MCLSDVVFLPCVHWRVLLLILLLVWFSLRALVCTAIDTTAEEVSSGTQYTGTKVPVYSSTLVQESTTGTFVSTSAKLVLALVQMWSPICFNCVHIVQLFPYIHFTLLLFSTNSFIIP